MTTPQDVREIAARALVDEVSRLAGLPASDGTESMASLAAFRRMSDAVLAAVEPVIRQQVAEEIAWHIEHPIGPQEVRWAPIARRWMAESAAIARSHSTRTEVSSDVPVAATSDDGGTSG